MFSVLIEFKSSVGNRLLTENPFLQPEFKMLYNINRKSKWIIHLLECNLCEIKYVEKNEGSFNFHWTFSRFYMKPLLVFPKTKPLWFYTKLFFDFCKSFLLLWVRKSFDWESSYKSFISFLENLERQFQWLKIVRMKNKYLLFQYLIFQSHELNWTEAFTGSVL